MRLPIKQLLISVGSFVFCAEAFGAACCGGGFAAPAIVMGDDEAQLAASYSFSQVVEDVGADAFWAKRQARESNLAFKVDVAHIFWDRWQAGASAPIISRARAGASSTGLGDVSGTLGYEYLPDWDYNPWRPKGIGYLQLTAPSGRPVQEAGAPYQIDARGRGFWAIGAGTLLNKIVGKWDVYSQLDFHRSFSRRYDSSQFKGVLQPGFGGSLGFGGGFSPADFRFGGGLSWTYEDPIDTKGTTDAKGAPQRFATATLSASYQFQTDWSAALTYGDQTLLGHPLNTSLSRFMILMLQKRWER
jgi:hypothetical protein